MASNALFPGTLDDFDVDAYDKELRESLNALTEPLPDFDEILAQGSYPANHTNHWAVIQSDQRQMNGYLNDNISLDPGIYTPNGNQQGWSAPLPPQFVIQDQALPQQQGNRVIPHEDELNKIVEQHKKTLIKHIDDQTLPLENEISSLKYDLELEKAKVRYLMCAVKDRDTYIEDHHLDPLPNKVDYETVDREAHAALLELGDAHHGALADLEVADDDGDDDFLPGVQAQPADGTIPANEAGDSSLGSKRKADEMDRADNEAAEDASDEATVAGPRQRERVKESKKAKVVAGKVDTKNKDKSKLKKSKGSKNAKAAAPLKKAGTKVESSQLKFEAQIHKFDAAGSTFVSLDQVCAVEALGVAVERQFVKRAISEVASDHKPVLPTGVLLVQASALKYTSHLADRFVEVRRGQLREIANELQTTATAGGARVERRFMCVLCAENELPMLNALISRAHHQP